MCSIRGKNLTQRNSHTYSSARCLAGHIVGSLGSQGPQGDHVPQQLPRVCSKTDPMAALGLHQAPGSFTLEASWPQDQFFQKLPGSRLGSFWKLLFCQAKLSFGNCTFIPTLGTANPSGSRAAFLHRDIKTFLLGSAVSAWPLYSLLHPPQCLPQLVRQQTDKITEMCKKFRTELLIRVSQCADVNATAVVGEEENSEASNSS